MGMLVDGNWVEDDHGLISKTGAFQRTRSSFRDKIGSDAFPAEAGRYHLFAGPSCPWAHRTVIGREIKDLEGFVGLTLAVQSRPEGWGFSSGIDDLQPVDGHLHLHRFYTAAVPDFTGRVTVPILWDREARTIVNNESSEILRMFNDAFTDVTGPGIDLYPREHRAAIDEINDYIYENINNGVYRCGFAKSQSAYEEAFHNLFAALDKIESRLDKSRYLVGDVLTEADIRLFTTLVRFDSVYHGHFKCNLRRIADYHNLHNYLLDLYQTPGLGETVDMPRIKHGYYVEAGLHINPTGIIPLGPEIDFHAPHDRDRFGAS
jgi:putative glutathione S-transferase